MLKFFVKRSFAGGNHVSGHATRDEAYAVYLREITAPSCSWYAMVTMYFAPNGFVLNRWIKPAAYETLRNGQATGDPIEDVCAEN